MSNAIVQALEDAARKVEQAVIDAARSVGHFFEDTGTRLKQAVDDLTTHDGKAAADLENAGKHADETPTVHGAGGAPTTPASAGSGGPNAGSEISQVDDFGNRVQQGLHDHTTDPRTSGQFPTGYDPLHGGSINDYVNRYSDGTFNEHGSPNWNWKDEAPNNGAIPGTEHPREIPVGEHIDRYGGSYGRFLSPADTSYSGRSLPADNLTQPYYRYRVARPLPANEGVVAKAFGEPGGGLQYRLEHPVQWYLDQKPPYLEVVQ